MKPTQHRLLAALLGVALLLGFGSALTACGSDDDDATAAPTAYITPSGQPCQPWMNNPHETDGSGIRPCDFAMPMTQPVRQPGMSDADYLLLGGLFGYYMGHHSYYNRPWYYDNYIGPAWTRYPGTYYSYRGRPVTRITTVNNYTTIVHNVDTKYASQERSYSSNPKYSGYKTANGKAYTGTTVPKKAFSGTNVPVNKAPLGNAPLGNSNKSTNPSPIKPSTSTNTGNSKSGYGKSFSGSNSSKSSGWGSFSKSYSGSSSRGGRR